MRKKIPELGVQAPNIAIYHLDGNAGKYIQFFIALLFEFCYVTFIQLCTIQFQKIRDTE